MQVMTPCMVGRHTVPVEMSRMQFQVFLLHIYF
jgi:hypothetical protein